MTHTLTITLGNAADLAWAQATVTAAHYLHAPVDPRARPMAYIIRDMSQMAAGGKLSGPGPDAVYDTWHELQRQKWQDIKLENPHIVQHI